MDQAGKVLVAKPGWVKHGHDESATQGAPSTRQKKKPAIYSLDIHPDGSRIVTGGEDGIVKIWKIDPILNPIMEHDDTVPKLLCSLNNHLGAVNCVRWSKCGNFLASGGVEGALLTWHLTTGGGSSTVFGSSTKIVEQWSCRSALKKHTHDINDLSWSPDGSYIASCSVDNTIIVWDVARNEPVRTLQGHEGWIEGVAWDPLNKYIASMAAKGVLKVWRTSDWKEETAIPADLFFHGNLLGVGETRHRIDWSPDASSLAASNGTIKKVNEEKTFTTPIFRRGEWDLRRTYCGNTRPTSVVRYCPVLAQVEQDTENGKSVVDTTILAIAGTDKRISVYTSCKSSPAFLFYKLFDEQIHDLSWSSDGHLLAACSHDGTIALIKFTEKHFQCKMLSPKETKLQLRKQLGSGATELLEAPDAAMMSVDPDVETKTVVPVPVKVQVHRPLVKRKSNVTRQGPVAKPQVRSNGARPESRKRSRVPKPHRLSPTSTKRPRPLAAPSPRQVQSTAPVRMDLPRSPARPRSGPPRAAARPAAVSSTMSQFLPAPPVDTPVVVYEWKQAGNRFSSDTRQQTLKIVATKKGSGHSQLALLSHDQKTTYWGVDLLGHVTMICANAHYVVCTCSNGSMYILSADSGRRLCPSVILDSPPVFLQINEGSHFMIVSHNGSLRTWKIGRGMFGVTKGIVTSVRAPINNLRSLLASKSVASRNITDMVRVERVSLTADGMPLVVTASHYCYTFQPNLGSWLCLTGDEFLGSHLMTSLPFSSSDRPSAIITDVQSNFMRAARATDLSVLDENEQIQRTLGHLEHLVATSLLLRDKKGFEYHSRSYVRKLIEFFDLAPCASRRLSEYMHGLCSPPSDAEGDTGLSELGVDKAAHVRDLLTLLQAKQQRLKLSLQESLSAMESSSSANHVVAEPVDLTEL